MTGPAGSFRPAPGPGASAPAPRRRWPWWWLAAGYMAVIFGLSAQPDPLPVLTAHVWDKALHLVEYGCLGALLLLALRAGGLGVRAALPIAVLVASLYGASDEVHQAFVPGRCADPWDWLADTLGGVAGAGAAALVLRVGWARASIRRVGRGG